jgi:flagellar basal-body rod protein FlgC
MDAIKISAHGLSAERTRINVTSMNLANASVTRTIDGGPYRAKSVVFKAVPYNEIRKQEDRTQNSITPLEPMKSPFDTELEKEMNALSTVKVDAIVDDPEPFKEVYDPSHPDADENGMVKLPNVNMMEQMVDLMNASRAFEANATAIDTAKQMANKTMELLR